MLFGFEDGQVENEQHHKSHYKYQNKPAISPLNDYLKLMVYLFSDETEENAKFKITQKASLVRVEPSKTKMDLVKELWEEILPHRELIVGGLRIRTQVKGVPDKIYNSSEMSDGERVIFYLIGQCLAAPRNGIIVIDEPELHLHKSIQTNLWRGIEKLRPDCLFVYFTHDVDFAAGKEDSKRIWMKSFDGKIWDWEELEKDDNLPNELLLEVLGSRKPIVFVEGDNGSFDTSLYRAILPSYLVIPRGSCTQVIQSVKALKANLQLHHLDVYGIIDRDRRLDVEIQKLEANSIFVLNVAEVENLFCVKEILNFVSQRLERDPDTDFEKVSKAIFIRLESELETQVSLKAISEIKFQLNLFDAKKKGVAALKLALESLAIGIDVEAIYAESQEAFEQVINTKDYEKLLCLYNRKTLELQVSAALGLANGQLPELVVRFAQGAYQKEIKNILKRYFGNFAVHMS